MQTATRGFLLRSAVDKRCVKSFTFLIWFSLEKSDRFESSVFPYETEWFQHVSFLHCFPTSNNLCLTCAGFDSVSATKLFPCSKIPASSKIKRMNTLQVTCFTGIRSNEKCNKKEHNAQRQEWIQPSNPKFTVGRLRGMFSLWHSEKTAIYGGRRKYSERKKRSSPTDWRNCDVCVGAFNASAGHVSRQSSKSYGALQRFTSSVPSGLVCGQFGCFDTQVPSEMAIVRQNLHESEKFRRKNSIGLSSHWKMRTKAVSKAWVLRATPSDASCHQIVSDKMFKTHSTSVEDRFKKSTVGLVSAKDFKMKRQLAAQAIENEQRIRWPQSLVRDFMYPCLGWIL